ncbi:MAG: hypothetical protein JJ992_04390, partial [Planctomycetes bacterium]|nr:hypothetical protein [Planctomycetota bacterium]
MLWKILKWTGIVLGSLIAVLLVTNAVFVWRSSAALEKRLQAIRDAGEPLSLSDLVPEPIPPEEDAAVYYRRVKDDLEAIGRELQAVRTSDAWPDGPLSPEDLQTIDRAMSAYPEVISNIQKAADCEDFSSGTRQGATLAEYQSGLLDDVQSYRAVSRYLLDRS